PVAAGVLDRQVIPVRSVHLALHKSAVDADTMMYVDYIVVLSKVQDGGNGDAALGPAARNERARAAEQLRVGGNVKPDIRELESLSQAAFEDEEAGGWDVCGRVGVWVCGCLVLDLFLVLVLA